MVSVHPQDFVLQVWKHPSPSSARSHPLWLRPQYLRFFGNVDRVFTLKARGLGLESPAWTASPVSGVPPSVQEATLCGFIPGILGSMGVWSMVGWEYGVWEYGVWTGILGSTSTWQFPHLFACLIYKGIPPHLRRRPTMMCNTGSQ